MVCFNWNLLFLRILEYRNYIKIDPDMNLWHHQTTKSWNVKGLVNEDSKLISHNSIFIPLFWFHTSKGAFPSRPIPPAVSHQHAREILRWPCCVMHRLLIKSIITHVNWIYIPRNAIKRSNFHYAMLAERCYRSLVFRQARWLVSDGFRYLTVVCSINWNFAYFENYVFAFISKPWRVEKFP